MMVTWRTWSARRRIPGATCIVDLFHAREHLHNLTRFVSRPQNVVMAHYIRARRKTVSGIKEGQGHADGGT